MKQITNTEMIHLMNSSKLSAVLGGFMNVELTKLHEMMLLGWLNSKAKCCANCKWNSAEEKTDNADLQDKLVCVNIKSPLLSDTVDKTDVCNHFEPMANEGE